LVLMVKRFLAKAAATAAIGLAVWYGATYSDTYRTADGTKFVEYNRWPKAGTTCSYFSWDDINQFPLVCGPTKLMREVGKYKK